ncbi:MAG: adenylate/guanylate cyclase domain-containing protein [SAR202 cluster bacterium]|jgi:class 3 adenylate cyclase|nr:adenylate/guanylate cyclase domain-containing protein [SAR202 cluster bacterium]MQG67391.1 adenylate/guanylate cyclase domain-containing protein [SAR202 cluster bacterium]HAL48954.1 hypothetical protein [Dehalococcoidia bacterium]|tara:strand:- start:5656 stop:6429 length:774 start_codon:yes stop_codon:yes gene_type:complete
MRVIADQAEGIAKVAKILGVDGNEVVVLLNEGRLAGALVTALRNRGTRPTPAVKNSVEKLVKQLEPKKEPPAPAEVNFGSLADDPLTREMTVIIMFTDIVGSTAMNQRLGDREARDVMRTHDDVIRKHTSLHGGIEVKSMGDGFMLTFPSARRAVSAGIAMLKELELPEFSSSGADISIRMGLTVGEPIREQQDLFGISVVLASRIGAMAKGGQILTSQIVHALLGNTGEFTFVPAGEHALKGISGLQKLYEIEWRN